MQNSSNLTEDASDSTFLIVAITDENEDLLKTLRKLYFIEINKLTHDFSFRVNHIFCAYFPW